MSDYVKVRETGRPQRLARLFHTSWQFGVWNSFVTKCPDFELRVEMEYVLRDDDHPSEVVEVRIGRYSASTRLDAAEMLDSVLNEAFEEGHLTFGAESAAGNEILLVLIEFADKNNLEWTEDRT